MDNKTKEFVIKDKTYILRRRCLKDTLIVGAMLTELLASPIITLVNQFVSGDRKNKEDVINQLNKIILNPDQLKESILTIFKNTENGIDTLIKIVEIISKEAIVKTKVVDDNNNYSFITEDFIFQDYLYLDDIDIVIELILNGYELNFQTGLKKIGKKFQSLGLI